jgi:cytoskeletal protein RodZ
LFGETLKKSREKTGLDLHEVAHTLRIQYEYLKALENGNIEKLPPDVYVRAYIREYARFLNIEAGPFLDEYAALTREKEKEVPPSSPPAEEKRSIPRIALIGSLVVAIAVFLVYFLSREEKAVVPGVPSVSDRAESVPSGAESPQMPVVQVAPPVVSDRAEPVPSKPGSQHTLDVTATETTWLRIEMDEGASEEVLMKPGETRKWTSRNGFGLKVGNAGGVRLVLDNRDIGVPGDKGHVIKLRLPEEGR